MNRPITFLIFLFLFLFLYAGCERSNGKEEANTEKIPVEISLVELGELSQSLQYNGDICAEYEVKVLSNITKSLLGFAPTLCFVRGPVDCVILDLPLNTKSFDIDFLGINLAVLG